MKQILGSNPLTSFAGYLLAGLLVVQEIMKTGATHWYDFAVPAAIAILGRVSADSNNARP